jgi:hypothetical protein
LNDVPNTSGASGLWVAGRAGMPVSWNSSTAQLKASAIPAAIAGVTGGATSTTWTAFLRYTGAQSLS